MKLLKEQYLDFDGDDDGRRIQIGRGKKLKNTSFLFFNLSIDEKGTNDDDDEEEEEDPDFQSGEEEDEEDEQEEEDPMKFKDRFSELERQRSLQDNQVELFDNEFEFDLSGFFSSKAEQLHLDEDLENIGQKSSMFKKGLALKQKKIQSKVLFFLSKFFVSSTIKFRRSDDERSK